jgi:hypothetical protein
MLLAGTGVAGNLDLRARGCCNWWRPGKFLPATEVLRWFCLGMLLRAFSWPMAFVMMAKNAQKLFFWTELFSNALYIASGLVWGGTIRLERGRHGLCGSLRSLCRHGLPDCSPFERLPVESGELGDRRDRMDCWRLACSFICKFIIPLAALGIGVSGYCHYRNFSRSKNSVPWCRPSGFRGGRVSS